MVEETKKILITGSNGLLGRALLKTLSKHYKVIGIDKKECDIIDKNRVEKFLKNLDLDILLHCAAYTDVDKAESEKKLTFLINKEGTKNILDALGRKDYLFIYLSTNYVFDGTKKKPYTEKDKPNPINVYGKSKLDGEKIVSSFKKHLILRTGWLFGPGGKNFVDTIINLSKKKNTIKVINDVFVSPTYTLDLAEAIKDIIGIYFTKKLDFGIYNITNSNSCSWFDFSKQIIELAGLKTKIIGVSFKDIKLKAKRPKNSLLSNEKFYKLTNYHLPSWQNALRRYLNAKFKK